MMAVLLGEGEERRVGEALHIEAPRLQTFHDYWNGLRGHSPAPQRTAFDIVQVPRKLIPHLILLDVLGDRQSFRYRVVGTEVVSRIGREFTGETVQDYYGRHESPEVVDGYISVVERRQPHVYTASLQSIGKDFLTYDRLAVPLLDEDGKVAQILACFDFRRTD